MLSPVVQYVDHMGKPEEGVGISPSPQKKPPQNTSIDLLGGQVTPPRKMRVVSLEKEGLGC